MAKLEPIVNQEPKEQLVPTFNKKEIEKIAQDVVSKEAPSGGTQLYKHTITITANYAGDINEETLVFIMPSATSLVGSDMFQIRNYIAGYFVEDRGTENETMCMIITKPTYGDGFIYCDSSGNLQQMAEIDGSVLTDTVTPL